MHRPNLPIFLPKEQLDKSASVKVNMLQSVYLQNNSNKNFAAKALPNYAQLSTLNGLVSVDVDGDGE